MKLLISVLTALTLAVAGACAVAQEIMLIEHEGVIHAIDYDANEITVDGARYRFALDARVRIGGSFGAVTMLTTDMKVRFISKHEGSGYPEILELEELPVGYVLEET